MEININKTYTITNITQKEFDMLYAGLCCLNEKSAQNYNKDINSYEIYGLAEKLSYNASEPLRAHKNEWKD